MISMLLLLLFLETLHTASSTDQLLKISSATAKSIYQDTYEADLAIDGDPNTSFISGSEPTQWLKLQLEEPNLVSRVVIINR